MFKEIQNGIFVFIISIIYSLIEIEMEGKYGWCAQLPTAKKVMADFTFYHLLMMLFIIITFYQLFHRKDIWIIVFYIAAFFFIEDYIWFILNPYFTFDKYSKENIPWHKHWIYGQPIENYFCYAITIFTYFKTKFKTEQMTSILNILILIFLTMSLAPLYHKFYFMIRK